MKFAKTLAIVALLPILLSMFSCSKSKDDIVVAQFADRKITLAEFEKAYSKVNPAYLPKKSGFEGFREFLDTMLKKEVMAYKADELGYDKDESVVQAMDTYKKMGLQAGYMKVMVVDKVKVTEDEVQAHYRNRDVTLSVKQILCDTPYEADEVYQSLQDGADFETVCKQYSKSPDASEGGRVVTLAYGSYAPSFQRPLFALPVGGFTKPIETPYGFFIIKVLKRDEPRRRDPLESIRETVEKEVRVQDEIALNNQLTDRIRADAGVEWYWDALVLLFNALPPDRPLNNPPDRSTEVYPLLYFGESDLDKPVVSYKNKTITVRDFSDMYDSSSFFARPRRDYRVAGIKRFLTEKIMNELIYEEMQRVHIEDNPIIKKAIRAKLEELMINRLYDDMINQQTVVSDKMIREYYNDNRQYFSVPEKRRFSVILTNSEEAAKEAYTRAMKGERFLALAKEYSIDEASLGKLAQTDLLSQGEQPEMDKYGFALANVGDITKPFQTGRGWMILKLTERSEATDYGLEEVRDQVRGTLKQIENDKRLDNLLAKWKEELNVQVFEDNLRKTDVEERTASPGQDKTSA